MVRISDALGGIGEQLEKARAEVSEAIEDLHRSIEDLRAQLEQAGRLDEADTAALDRVRAAAQALDDIVPDTPAQDTPAQEGGPAPA